MKTLTKKANSPYMLFVNKVETKPSLTTLTMVLRRKKRTTNDNNKPKKANSSFL